MKIGHGLCLVAVLTAGLSFGCSSSSSGGGTDASTGTGGSTASGGSTSTGGTTATTGGATSTGGTTTATGGTTSTGGGDAGPSGPPSITITSPKAGAVFTPETLDDGTDLPVTFTVQNFVLETAAQQGFDKCPKGKCGHVHMFAHLASKPKSECNDVPDGLGNLYNAAAFGAKEGDTTATEAIGFDYCPTLTGTRIILLELHNDDHSAVNDASGNVISTTVTVTVNAGDAGTDAGTDAGKDAH